MNITNRFSRYYLLLVDIGVAVGDGVLLGCVDGGPVHGGGGTSLRRERGGRDGGLDDAQFMHSMRTTRRQGDSCLRGEYNKSKS